MTDSTVPSSHYISTVKALVKMIEQNDELRGELRDYEDAFEQLTKDAHNAENAASWLSAGSGEAVKESVRSAFNQLSSDEIVDLARDIPDDAHLYEDQEPVNVPHWSLFHLGEGEQPIDKPLSFYQQAIAYHQMQLKEATRAAGNLTGVYGLDRTEELADLGAQIRGIPRQDVTYDTQAIADALVADADEPIPYTITEPAPDFSNTTEDEPLTYSLAEAAAILNRQGIDTGQNKLKKFLNTGICWTDAFGTPRGIAGDYLVETEPANPSRDAVVRITPEGVNELERVLNVAV